MAGRDRKNSLKELFSAEVSRAVSPPAVLQRAPEVKSMGFAEGEGGQKELEGQPGAPAAATPTPAPETQRATSGAVKAMGLSLSSITREAEEARALREALENGERVVSLDPSAIVASFVNDRLDWTGHEDTDFEALLESMRESGQQVPILVRPVEGEPGRYQVAYGHRRLRAARQLGLPVKALVRTLSDDELVLAQGKENAERRNLSFIERALFARALSERGVSRKLIGEALGGLKKDEMSRLMRVAETVPYPIIYRIGPAPKTGRNRWLALADLFDGDKGAQFEKASDEAHAPDFARLDSDQRFQRIFSRVSAPKPKAEKAARMLNARDGRPLARLEARENGRGTTLVFEQPLTPEFIAALEGELVSLFERFGGARPNG